MAPAKNTETRNISAWSGLKYETIEPVKSKISQKGDHATTSVSFLWQIAEIFPFFKQ